jgi:hypothetical protein
MDDARDLSRHVPRIDKALQDAEQSRRLNPRALVVPNTSNTLRADLDSLEHTTVAVRSMFRTILDGVRSNPTTDPSKGEDSRLVFAALLGDVATAVQAFGDLDRADGTDQVDVTEGALAATLNTLREARDRIDDLQLIDAGSHGGWELSDPVRQTVERVLHDLDLAGHARRRPATKPVPPRVDPLEIIKSARHLLHGPKPAGGPRRPSARRPMTADMTGPHRLPLARAPHAGDDSSTTGRLLATDTARLRAATGPAGRAGRGGRGNISPGRRSR